MRNFGLSSRRRAVGGIDLHGGSRGADTHADTLNDPEIAQAIHRRPLALPRPVSSLVGSAANSGAKRQLSIPGEVGGGVIFAAVIIAPLLIVAVIAFAYLTIVPELVQH
jgi:hypothetical protein